MSPLISEESAEKTRGRRKHWPLYLALGLVAAPLLVPAVVAVYPLRLDLPGGYVFWMSSARLPDRALPRPFYTRHELVAEPGRANLAGYDDVMYQYAGTLRAHGFCLGHWNFSVCWFRGKRVK